MSQCVIFFFTFFSKYVIINLAESNANGFQDLQRHYAPLGFTACIYVIIKLVLLRKTAVFRTVVFLTHEFLL